MKRFSKSECLQDIRRRILSTDISPGYNRYEASLSQHYYMARTPLREVLQRLQAKAMSS